MSEFFEVGIERVPLLIDRMINESKQITKENLGTIELFQDIKNMDSFCDNIWFCKLLSYLNNKNQRKEIKLNVHKIAANDKQLVTRVIDKMRHQINDDFVGWLYLLTPTSPKFKQIVDEHLEKNYPELITKEEEE